MSDSIGDKEKYLNENRILKNKVKELSQLNTLFRTMRVTTAMETLLQNTVETCHRAFGVDRALIFVINKNKAVLEGKGVFPASPTNQEILKAVIPITREVGRSNFSNVIYENHADEFGTLDGFDDNLKEVLKPLISNYSYVVPMHLRYRESYGDDEDCNHMNCPVLNIEIKELRTTQVFPNQQELLSCLQCPLFPVNGVIVLDNNKSKKEMSKEFLENFIMFANHVSLAVDDIQLHQEIKILAIRDGLTNLYNHRHFKKSIEVEISRSRRYSRSFSLIFIDVDFFKKYNDSCGHQAGDDTLRIVAEILEEGSRPVDIVARYGGEEFCIILPETNEDGALIFAERKRQAIEEREFFGQEKLPNKNLTCSFGIATFPDDMSKDHHDIIKLADHRLYIAKGAGRNTVITRSNEKG